MIGLFKRWLIGLLARLSCLRPRPRGTRLDISDLIDVDSVGSSRSTKAQNENNDRTGLN
jgi:hypothetical protein